MTRRTVAAWFATLAFAAGCKEATSVKISDSLDDAQALWQASNIQTYDYTFSISCYCATALRPIKVTVSGGVPVSVVYADSAGGTVTEGFFNDYLTVDRIFATLRAKLDQGPATFEAQYDANLGYPKHVSIDPNVLTADDELGIAISILNNPTQP